MLGPLLQATRIAALLPFFYCEFSGNGLVGYRRGAAAMTDLSGEIPRDDLRNLVRVISACTLGLWAFAAGLLIGVFLFS